MLSNIIEKKFLKLFDAIEYGTISLTMPDGKTYEFAGPQPGPHGQMTIYTTSMIMNLYARGDIGFADDYRNGNWDSEDLVSLINCCLKNDEALRDCIFGSGIFSALVRFTYMLKENSIKGSKKNIHAHYDLGNDFYSLWLDETMSYSAGIYNGAGSLKDAQNNKYDRILERMSGNSGNVLEIGCGWGGFMERASTVQGRDVKGVTISKEQYDYAKKRISQFSGIDASVVLQDYRLQTGKYKNIVSIEMFEAVGEKYWATYFGKLKELLENKGKAVIQTITIGDKYFENYRKSGDAIRTYIFPGGMLPSETVFAQKAAESGLVVADKFLFGQDYATTLKEWLKNFDAKIEQVKALGFDNKFIRLWRYYLAACAASFEVNRTNVMQVELQHA